MRRLVLKGLLVGVESSLKLVVEWAAEVGLK
jgi:hypothetical protein